MRRVFTILAAVIISFYCVAQTPQKMSYQAVIRNAGNTLVTSHSVGMRISILQGTGFSVRCFKGKGQVFQVLTTTAPSSIGSTTAISGGNITSDGGEYITARGVCWSTSKNPTIANNKTIDGTGTGAFTSSLTGLAQGYTSYVRAYATNSAGTGYGNQDSLKTIEENGPIIFNPNLTYGSVSDVDGNNYKTIQIGPQIWMAENLKTTKFNNAVNIPNVTDSTAWINLTTPGYCWYNNDELTYKNTYGALYNWYAVNTGKLCPTGWHVPSKAEWTNLTDYLGGSSVAGGKIKETGTTHWNSPNTGATNESGFTGLPRGYRSLYSTNFYGNGYMGYWWTSTEEPSNNGASPAFYYRGLHNTLIFIDESLSQSIEEAGLSVRCVTN